ncbi:hypothetical protein [Streptomyces olivoreticuli]|uniref:hypothetical protein n=1 Tax=Streptomyces olivoreticuli TaxID=68246 RepID=UPI0013C33608|nr:hypothetical protein [Streptomyces olivoreticuli]
MFVFAVGWVFIGLVGPRALEPKFNSFESLPLWESFLEHLHMAVFMCLVVGLPTLIIAISAGLTRHRMEPGKFRAIMAAVLLLPEWLLLAADTPIYLWVQTTIQVVFATVVMPVPLIPTPTKSVGAAVGRSAA